MAKRMMSDGVSFNVDGATLESGEYVGPDVVWGDVDDETAGLARCQMLRGEDARMKKRSEYMRLLDDCRGQKGLKGGFNNGLGCIALVRTGHIFSKVASQLLGYLGAESGCPLSPK